MKEQYFWNGLNDVIFLLQIISSSKINLPSFGNTITVSRLPKSPTIATMVKLTPSIQKLTESKTGLIKSNFSWQ